MLRKEKEKDFFCLFRAKLILESIQGESELEESMETEEYVEGKEEESEFKENEEFQLGVRGPISDKGGGGSPERDH